MPNFSSGLAIEETTLLFCAIIEALIPLLIWLFWDLEHRRVATRGRVAMTREKA